MACQSVAVSTAQVSQVVLDEQTMRGMLAKLLGIDPSAINFQHWDIGDRVNYHKSKRTYQLKNTYDRVEATISFGDLSYGRVFITQRIDDGEGTLTLEVSASTSQASQARAKKDELEQAFAKQCQIAQQVSVVKRLAQLGQLSNIKQSDNGVTLRLTVEI